MAYTPEEIQAAGLDDCRTFVKLLWQHLGLPPLDLIQLDILHFLQHGGDRIVVEAFRGIGKTWLTAAYALWVLFCDPQKKIMIVSANQKHAENVARFMRGIIETWELVDFLKPSLNTSPGAKDSILAFDVGPARPDVTPSVGAFGILGQLTGGRADVIIPDDVEIPKNSGTFEQRDKIAERTKEFAAVLKPNGQIRYLGTPQTEDSLYPKLAEREYTIRIWPIEVPKNPDLYAGKLGPCIQAMIEAGYSPGTPTEPRRFNKGEIDSRRIEYGRSGFALQMMLDTTLSDIDKHPLKTTDLLIEDVDNDVAHMKYLWARDKQAVYNDLPSWGLAGDVFLRSLWKSAEVSPYSFTVMAIDPSGRGKDETAYAVIRFLNGTLFLIASGGFQEGYAESTLKGLAAVAARYKVTDLVLEENYGGGMFASLLKPYMLKAVDALNAKAKEAQDRRGVGRWAEDVWHSVQKELFICDTLEPVMNAHRLVIDRRVIERDREQQQDDQQYSLVYQMTRMHREKGALAHEDRLEALAMAAQFCQDKLDRDQDRVITAQNDDKLDEELRRYREHMIAVGTQNDILGGPVEPAYLTWM